MLITCETVLELTSCAAQARLATLARGGGLTGTAQAAYEHWLARLIPVGPFGDVPSASKPVQVRFPGTVYRDDTMTVTLRWEAAGATGSLFPLLDADITLTPADENTARLAVTGSHRPPLGRLGVGLDRVILHGVATATLRELLGSVAETLASPAGQVPGRRGRRVHPGRGPPAGPGRA